MSAKTPSSLPASRDAALRSIAVSAAANIPGVDFASITLQEAHERLRTLAATDPLAEDGCPSVRAGRGPCYAAVTEDRFVLVNDVSATMAFPRYGSRAAEHGIGAQAAIQLVHNGDRAGLNLYSRRQEVFDRSTVQFAELFATQAAALLQYAVQVEQLGEALHTRTDIGTAVGIVMERYSIDRNSAFAFLVRNSSNRNLKLRLLAQQVIDGTFESTPAEDARSQQWP